MVRSVRAATWLLVAAIAGALPVACSAADEQATGTTGTGAGGSGGSGGALAVSLPQALDGAMWANPSTYKTIPLRISVTGQADAVTAKVGKHAVTAVASGTGSWVATLPIASIPDGPIGVEVEATAGDRKGTAKATLTLGRAGLQLTDFDQVGTAHTPFVHRTAEGVFLSYCDRSASDHKGRAWLRRIDGAGAFSTDKIQLASSPDEVLYAYVAFGKTSVGVLYKTLGSPYKTFFTLVDPRGKVLHAPVALDPAGEDGAYGGDVAYDGSGFVAVWRSFDAMASQVRWARFDEKSGEMTGPVVVAGSGAGDAADPVGGFDPFSFVKVRTVGTSSAVGFVRYHYSAPRQLAVPRAELASVNADGTVDGTTILGHPNDFTWHRESRVYGVAGRLVSIHSRVDLDDPAPNPANLFYASHLDTHAHVAPHGDPGTPMFSAVDDREEPFLLAHPDTFGVLAWLDDRAYTVDPNHGKIDLYVAKVKDDLTLDGDPTVFEQVSFTSGLADLNATLVGTNAMMFWVDFRHSVGTDFKPELWMDTAWY